MKVSLVIFVGASACLMTAASAQAGTQVTSPPWYNNGVVLRPAHHIAANGRCGGMSYGTGERTCGTATGGPVGGLTDRN